MDANKCNITGYVMTKYNNLVWGVNCEDPNKAILENYINYLDCPDITIKQCNPDVCSNPTIIFTCALAITGITQAAVVAPDYDYEFTPIIQAAFAPMTHVWTYDATVFTMVGSVNDPVLKLKLKTGKVLSILSTQIGISILDYNGCSKTKTCWLDKGLMNCTEGYLPCYLPGVLSVTHD